MDIKYNGISLGSKDGYCYICDLQRASHHGVLTTKGFRCSVCNGCYEEYKVDEPKRKK